MNFKILYNRLASIDSKELEARIQGNYNKEIIGYVKDYLARVIVNPEIAEEQFITPADIELVFDVYGINSTSKRLSQEALAEKYEVTPSRAAARFAVVVKTIEREQTKGEEIGL